MKLGIDKTAMIRVRAGPLDFAAAVCACSGVAANPDILSASAPATDRRNRGAVS
jgi:hypothetical protein